MPLIELSTALVAAGSGLVVPFVNKVLEKSAQRLGGHMDEHLATLFTRAYEYLAPTGREAQSVEPKLLKTVVENAPYETDPTLAEKWAALLANAADPAQRITVQVGFTEVLRQLQPVDTLVLNSLYLSSITGVSKIESNHAVVDSDVFKFLGYRDGQLALDNLVRLRLCQEGRPSQGNYVFLSTEFGFRFMQAVTPPTL